MSTTHHISFEQFAENYVDILDSVRKEQTPIVVDYASGESLLIRPFSPADAASDAAEAPRAGAAPVTDEHTPQQPSRDQPTQDPELDTDNKSSVGAMYDIDPNSVTPG